ncbi:MAG: YigZ family protein [Desulfamplus sp.]|nr:YigZ family protein [Desulfamplus sp.]
MEFFYSIDDERRTEIKIKRSTFISSLRYVDNIPDAKEFISYIASEHKMATHNCWAYIVGDKGDISHSSDNGEPSGTAGKPMLNTLQAHKMTNISAVVTRYYGGVKLGVRGLIDAYSQSILSAIELKPLRKIVKVRKYIVDLPYSFNETLIYHLNNLQAKITDTRYSDKISHDVEADEAIWHSVEALLNEYQGSGRLKFVIGCC